MNYGQLKTTVASWINRSDLTSDIATIIEMAEATIRTDVRVAAMESLVTGSLVDGSAALPDRFLESRRLLVDSKLHDYVTPDQYQEEIEVSSTLRHYTAFAGSIHVIGGGTNSYSLLCYRWFDALAADGDTNWLLTNYPNVYVYQALKQAAVFVKDANAAQGYEVLYQQAKNAVNGIDKAASNPGAMTIRSRSVA